jgi:hypothetical protein
MVVVLMKGEGQPAVLDLVPPVVLDTERARIGFEAVHQVALLEVVRLHRGWMEVAGLQGGAEDPAVARLVQGHIGSKVVLRWEERCTARQHDRPLVASPPAQRQAVAVVVHRHLLP